MNWTADGWSYWPQAWTADGWPVLGQPWTADGWIADGEASDDVGGPLFRPGLKHKRITLPEAQPIDWKAVAAKARIKRFERLASKAAAKALRAAEKAEREEREAQRLAAEQAAREASEAARKVAEEREVARGLVEAAKSRAKAKKLAEDAAEAARVLAAEELQKAADERFFQNQVTPELLKELIAVDSQVGEGLDALIPVLTEEFKDLDAEKPIKGTETPLQKAALKALEAILETTRRIH